jgi:hypothetical protein
MTVNSPASARRMMRDQLKMQRSVHASTSSLCGLAMIEAQEVRSKIASLLRNDISMEDFSQWVVDESWNMHKDSSQVAIDLVSNIHLLLAEHDSHNSVDVRQELESLLYADAVPRLVISDDAISSPVIVSRSAYPSFWINPEAPWVAA